MFLQEPGTKDEVLEDMQTLKGAQEHFVGSFTAYRSLLPIDFGETTLCPSSLPDELSGRSQMQTGERRAHMKGGGGSWLQSAKQSLKLPSISSTTSPTQ